MKAVICVKTVRAELLFSNTNQKFVINPFDYYALEQLKMLKVTSSEPVEVTAVIMGISDRHIIAELNALGCDHIVYLTDSAFAGADTLATSYVLYKAIAVKLEFDYIFCGDHSIDGETGHIGISIAERFHIPYIGNVEEIDIQDGRLCFESLEDGWRCKYELKNKAVITFRNCTIKQTKLSLMQIKRAKSIPYEIWDANEIGADKQRCGLLGSRTKVLTASSTFGLNFESKETMFLDGDEKANSFQILLKAGGIYG